MSRETCEHGVDINGTLSCTDCEAEWVESQKAGNSRDDFEDYFFATRKRGRDVDFTERDDGTYVHDHVQRHWYTWQIARGERSYKPVDRQ